MGNEQGKEVKAAVKRCKEVAVGPGSKSKKYGEGNIRWAIRMANVTTGRDPGKLPENIAQVRNLVCDLMEIRDKYGSNKEIEAAIKTLKVLGVVGILFMKASNTDSAVNLWEIMGLNSRPSEKGPGGEEEAMPSAFQAKEQKGVGLRDPQDIAKEYPIQVVNGQAQYVPLNPRMVAIFMEKARDGLGTEEVLLWFTAFSADLTPTDMATILMSAPGCAADKEIIDTKLKELTTEYERTHPSDAPRPLPYFTAREIMGLDLTQDQQAQPQFHAGRVQARAWYIEALQYLQKIKSRSPRAVQMKQGPKEDYASFIDRLYAQIDQEQNSPEVKIYLKQSLSLANANPECKKAMSHLKPESTLEEKLRACQEVGSTSYKMNMLAQALQQQSQVCQVQQGRGKPQGNNRRPGQSLKCFNCGKPGHLARNCRAPRKCNKCGKAGHIATDCWDMQGKQQGNWQKGRAAAPIKQVQQFQTAVSTTQNQQQCQLIQPSAPPMESLMDI
uniref:Gag polyprotein n=1 Tax=Feline immunodeficiency virus TaxID=11673 RepID=P89686_9RETR|nr:Gag polyprotein [Feline immunodeficiency virus]AAU20797.1 gag protein [Feline immunodeficiency virus]